MGSTKKNLLMHYNFDSFIILLKQAVKQKNTFLALKNTRKNRFFSKIMLKNRLISSVTNKKKKQKKILLLTLYYNFEFLNIFNSSYIQKKKYMFLKKHYYISAS